MIMESIEVTEEEVVTIVPSKASGLGKLLELSTLDLMQKRDVMPYLQRVAFYPSPTQTIGTTIEGLKRGLSIVLVDFYPFAGRLQVATDGQPPVILCNDAGVEFCEASAPNTSLSEIDVSRACDPFFRQLIRRGSYETADPLHDDVPLLSIQVTKFTCGGLCIAWSFDHIIGDGNSLWHFISSWAEVCKGERVSCFPYHSRDFEKTHLQLKDLHHELETFPSRSFSYRFTDMSMGIIAKSFKFTAEQIGKLKLMAFSPNQLNGTKFSSFEILSAHVWRMITKARNIPEKTRTIGYSIACNIRGKFSPPLPTTFSGNAILMPIAQASVEEVESKDISFAASRIHEAIHNFSIDDILSCIRKYKINSTDNPLGLGIDEGVHVWHGGSLRFPLYETDFGWGKAFSVKNVRCLWDGFCYFDPSPSENAEYSAEITLCLKPDVMEKFSQQAFGNI